MLVSRVSPEERLVQRHVYCLGKTHVAHVCYNSQISRHELEGVQLDWMTVVYLLLHLCLYVLTVALIGTSDRSLFVELLAWQTGLVVPLLCFPPCAGSIH